MSLGMIIILYSYGSTGSVPPPGANIMITENGEQMITEDNELMITE